MSVPQPTGAFEWTQAPFGRILRCGPLLEAADHFFTTRDFAPPGPDDGAPLADAVGISPEHLLTARQVHGAAVVIAPRGSVDRWAPPEADVLATDDPAYALTVRVADCAPVLIADRRLGVVAAVHAGWRGTVAGAVGAGVRGLAEHFGSSPADLVAAIGPCLGPCCGEVGEEVVDAFRRAGYGGDAIGRWFVRAPGARPSLNLWAANRDQLEMAGVPAPQIHVAELCTRTHSGVFHSYRAAGAAAGRMYAVIRGLEPEDSAQARQLSARGRRRVSAAPSHNAVQRRERQAEPR